MLASVNEYVQERVVMGISRHLFRFLSSEVRSGDEPGTIVENADSELEETSSLEVELPPLEGHELGEMIPVRLQAIVTELGNLELWMQHTGSEQRWQLSFKVRTE